MRDPRYSLHPLVLATVTVIMAGCGPGEGPAVTGSAACAAGELLLAGACCQPAGVPPDGCGPGFEWDSDGGCNPILPSGPCAPGQTAVPGDTQCHEVASCGTGEYGFIPVDATTQFVRGAYAGSDSDGTQAKPWKRIQDGIDHADSGAIVALAAGTYAEDPLIQSRPVRLWGRCPALVQMVGTGAGAALTITGASTSHSEVHGMAITGPRAGILTTGSGEVTVDRVWVHDTGGTGIGVQSGATPTRIRVTASLIEATTGMGVFVQGADATIESTVVRANHLYSHAMFGSGIGIEADPATHKRATLTLRSALLEQNQGGGVLVEGSDATIEATVVHASQPSSDGSAGMGIEMHHDPTTHERATLTLRTSFLEQNYGVGVFVEGSDATIESTVVRATQSYSDGIYGDGISVVFHGSSTTATITSTKVEANNRAGISNLSAAVTLLSSIVQCNKFALDGEQSVNDQPFRFEGKGNLCGCEKLDCICPVLSAGLSPPPPIPPGDP